MEIAIATSPGAPERDQLAGEDLLGADVVGDRGHGGGVVVEGDRREATGEGVGGEVLGVGGRAAIAEGEQAAALLEALAELVGGASDRAGVDHGAQRGHLARLFQSGGADVGEHRVEVGATRALEGIEEVRRVALDLLERGAGVTEDGVADLDVLDQVDRDLLSGAVLLDHRGGAADLGDPGLDGVVAAGDAGLVDQVGLLEEDVDQLPEHVVGGLLGLLDDRVRHRSGRRRSASAPSIRPRRRTSR